MAHEMKEVDIAGMRTVARLDSRHKIMAECVCGHSRELHPLSLHRRLGAGMTIDGVRAKLRCHKCEAIKPAIKVYRRVLSSINARRQ